MQTMTEGDDRTSQLTDRSVGDARGRGWNKTSRQAARISGALPCLEDFGIPDRVPVDEHWPLGLAELADVVGAHNALRIAEIVGGQALYFSEHPDPLPFVEFLGRELSLYFVENCFGHTVTFPTANRLLIRVKRAGIVSAVRAGTIALADAAAIARTSRTYMSHLVNHTSEGEGVAPAIVPPSRETSLLSAAVKIVRRHLTIGGSGAEGGDAVIAAIMGLSGRSPDELSLVADDDGAPL